MAHTKPETTQSHIMPRIVAIALAGFLAFGTLSGTAQACSCVRASEATLTNTYNKADIVAQIRILEAGSSHNKIPYITYAAEPITVYKGRLGDRFSLREDNNSCANSYQKGQIVDVAISRDTGRMTLANQCTQMQIQEYLRIDATRNAPMTTTPMDEATVVDDEAGIE